MFSKTEPNSVFLRYLLNKECLVFSSEDIWKGSLRDSNIETPCTYSAFFCKLERWVNTCSEMAEIGRKSILNVWSTVFKRQRAAIENVSKRQNIFFSKFVHRSTLLSSRKVVENYDACKFYSSRFPSSIKKKLYSSRFGTIISREGDGYSCDFALKYFRTSKQKLN